MLLPLQKSPRDSRRRLHPFRRDRGAGAIPLTKKSSSVSLMAPAMRYPTHIFIGGIAMSVVDLVHEHLGPQQIQQISQELGVDPNTAQNAVQAAVPMMVGGMASTADQPGGASTIQSLLGSHSGALDNLGSLLGGGALGGLLGGGGGGGLADVAGGGLLGKILGQHQQTVQQGVQQASGL